MTWHDLAATEEIIRSSLERVLLKTVHRLVHKPTLELRARRSGR